MGEEQKYRRDAVIVEGLLFSFVLLLCLGSAELEAAENSVRSVVREKGRAMFWRNFKRRGRKKDALMMPFIRYWDIEIQTCFCYFFFCFGLSSNTANLLLFFCGVWHRSYIRSFKIELCFWLC